MKLSREHRELIEHLRANGITRERLEVFENNPIAMADYLAQQSDDFIRKYDSTTDVVYKENDNAVIPAEPEQHWVDVEEVGEAVYELRKEFESEDKILHTRVQELEQKVKDLTEQLSIFNRVSDIALKIALQWINNKQSST